MIVYRATNQRNGRVYIGVTVGRFSARRAQHRYRANSSSATGNTPFVKAIRKYGWDAFMWEVVERCETQDALYAAERKWIAAHDSMNRRKGYNRTEGGGGAPGLIISPEQRQKLAKAHKGRRHSAESRAKRSLSLRGRKPSEAAMAALRSRVFTPEMRTAMSLRMSGRSITWSPEGLANVRAAAKQKSAKDQTSKVKRSHASAIHTRRAAGESFASIARDYAVTASCVFYFCQRNPL